jgi:hypothetical protein
VKRTSNTERGRRRARSADASIRAAVEHARAARIWAMERRLGARLDELRRAGGRAEHDALVAMLRRVADRADRGRAERGADRR